jgi:trimeric autotransporter adhesin
VVDLHQIASPKLRRTMMVGIRFQSPSVSLCFKRVLGPITAALALLAFVPQARSDTPTFTVTNTTFPSTVVGQSTSQNVTLTVNTAVPITSISIAAGFTEYSISGVTGCTVNSSGTTIVAASTVCTIAVKYSPAVPGSAASPTLGRNAPMLVSDVESGSPVTYAFGLTGSATAAVSQMAPAMLSLFAGAPLTGLPAAAQGLGSTTAGYGGNGGPANEAVFSFSGYTSPTGCSPYTLTQPMARDSAGNMYVIDAGNLVIRKIDNTSDHNVTVVAGVQGKGSAFGSFNNAYLNTPVGIVADAAGNIFFIDSSACTGGFGMVRRVDAVTGAITSVAGQNFTGTYNSASGGGTCTGSTGSAGYSWECGDGGLASYANIPYASQLAIDATGNLYVWEAGGGGYLRKIDMSTGLISTTASAAQLGENTPEGGMTLAADGNFYVSVDTGTHTYIEQFNPNTQAVTQIAGGGANGGNYCSVTVAQAGYPASNMFFDGTESSSGDLSSDGAGNIYIDQGLCNGNYYTYEGPAVWRINLATDYAFLETKSEAGDGSETGYNSYYGYLTDPLNAIPDGLGNLYLMTYNQIAELGGASGALNYTSTIDYTTNPQTLTATYANVGNATEPNPASSFVVGTSFVLNSTGDTAACSAISELAIGGTCNLDVEFTPVSAGVVTDTLNLTEAGGGTVGLITNDLTVALNGSALAEPLIAFTPPTINFGTQLENTVSADMAVTISNPGTGPLTITNSFPDNGSFTGFQVDTSNPGTCPSPGSLAAGDSCTINVQFAPTTLGALTENLVVNSNASNVNVNLTASLLTGNSVATLPPAASLAPNPLAFGGQVLSVASPAQIVTLSNTGSATITGIVPTITGTNPGDFTLLTTGTNICGTSLAAGSTCNFYITFTPAATGSRTATLSVADSATGSPQTASLTGTGVQFQSNVGQPTAAQPVSVYFSTAGTLSSIQVLTQGAANLDFTMTAGGTCATGNAYTAGQSCTVDVSFNPLFAGARYGAVLLTDAGGDLLATTYLPGTGFAPQIVFSPGTQTGLVTAGSIYPTGVAVDASGNVYIVDTQGNAVLKLPKTAGGYGTAVKVGSGYNEPWGVAVDGAGNVFVGDYAGGNVVEVPWSGSAYGPQVNLPLGATSRQPRGITVDSAGNVYFADYAHGVVAEIPLTSSGYGSLVILPFTGINSPNDVKVDLNGDVFCADTYGHNVVMLPWTGTGYGTQTVVATSTDNPIGIAFDANGDVYIATQIQQGGGYIDEVPSIGSGYGTPVKLAYAVGTPNEIALDGAGNLFVDEPSTGQVGKIDVADPPSLAFANTNVGSTSSDSPKTVAATNIGNVDLYFNAQDNNPVYPLDFPINNNDSNLCEEDNSVDTGSSCDVSVNFTPTTSGSLSEDVVLTDNNLNGNGVTQSIQVTGNGIAATAPAVTLNPTSLTFSQASGTTSAIQSSTLTNTGTAPLTITATALTGTNASSFTEEDNCVASSPIAVNGTCTISVKFAPTATGSFTAAVSITDNASNSPQSLSLNGTGTTAGAPIASLTPSVLAFPATTVGDGSQLVASLHNTGNASLNNISMTITGANAGMFNINPTGSCQGLTTLPEDSSCTITVHFDPTVPGNFAAVLTVTDNATGSPQTLLLTGEGTQPELQFTPGQFDYIAGTPGMLGDTGSGPAINALIGGGYGIAIDSTGLVYFSDYDFNTVWQIDDNGNINVYAGVPVEAPGHGTYSGDNGPAASATLDAPEQIAFDPSGNLYIADRFNNLIRMVNSAGTITTFAGNYGNGFGGYAGDGGPANQATLSSPQGVTSDPQGNIYIADTSNFVIRKVDTTGTITLFAGTPGVSGYSGDNGPALSAKLGQCYQLATDQKGNLYIADFSNGVVRKVDSSGTITTYAGGGTGLVTATPQPATSVNLNNGPVGLAVDPGGNLYVLGLGQTNTPGVFVVNASQQISQIVGGGVGLTNGGPANVETTDLNAIAVDNSGNLYVDDAFENLVAEIGPNGDLLFPDTPVNTVSAPLTVTLTNTGNAPLSFANQNDDDVTRGKQGRLGKGVKGSAQRPRSNVVDFNSYGSISGPFAIASAGTCNFDDGIQPGASCTMNVTFDPTVVGAASGSINIYTTSGNGGSTTNTILLNGNGTAGSSTPAATLAPNLTFPNTNVATTSAALAATLSNTGSGTLTISNIAIGGTNPADFAIATGSNACGTSLATSATCSIYVTFTPASAASFSGTLTVTDNASPTTQSVTLSGTGTTAAAPIATLTSTLAFPSTLAGSQSTAMTATLSNSGNATLNISSIALAGTNPADFTISTGSNACGATLAADASCSIYIVFNPVSAASFTATLNVADNAAGSPQSTSLTGTGLAPPDFNISATPSAQSVAAGAAATYTVTLNSTNGSFEPEITLTASGLPPGATASFAPPQVSVSDGNAASILTVQTAGGQTAQSRGSVWPFATPALALLLLVPFRRWRRVWRGKMMLLIVGLVSMAAAISLSACGGGFALTNQSKTYTITVTGASGTDTHTTTVQLTVQ